MFIFMFIFFSKMLCSQDLKGIYVIPSALNAFRKYR